MISNRKYDRPEVKQITKQWVKENCKNITDRDIVLLKTIIQNKRRLLRRDQIEILCPLKFASTDRLNKRLKTLFKLHIIDKIYPPVGLGEGSSKQIVCLDKAGIILLNAEKYNKPIITDSLGNRSLPMGWEHKVMLNDYECNINQISSKYNGEIMYYLSEEPCLFNDSKIIPDIFCFLKVNGKGYLFFIEVDMGTEDIPYVKHKIDLYTDYYLSKAWTHSPWVRLFKCPSFPRILFLTEQTRGKRVEVLSQYTQESPLRFIFGYHTNFISILESILKG